MSTTINPVTQTADVAVKAASNSGARDPSLRATGSERSRVPAAMADAKPRPIAAAWVTEGTAGVTSGHDDNRSGALPCSRRCDRRGAPGEAQARSVCSRGPARSERSERGHGPQRASAASRLDLIEPNSAVQSWTNLGSGALPRVPVSSGVGCVGGSSSDQTGRVGDISQQPRADMRTHPPPAGRHRDPRERRCTVHLTGAFL